MKWAGIGVGVLVRSATVGFLSAFYGFSGLIAGISITSLSLYAFVEKNSRNTKLDISKARQFLKDYISQYSNAFSERFKDYDIEKNIVELNEEEILQRYRKAFENGLSPILTYAIIHDEKGFIRIGKTRNTMNVRWTKYLNKAFDPTCPEKGQFYDDIKEYSIYDTNGDFDGGKSRKEASKHFKRILLDCQYGNSMAETERRGAISEEFWTIFVNRDKTSDKGYDLGMNNLYNPIVGDLFAQDVLNPHWIDIDIGKVISLMKEGYRKWDVAAILGVSSSTIENRVQSLSGKSYEDYQIELLTPIIMAFRERGLSGREIIRHFVRYSNPTSQIFTKERARRLNINGFLSIEHYNPMELDEFLKPLLIEFVRRNLDREQIGIELKELEIKNLNKRYYEGSVISGLFSRLFDRHSLTDLKFIYIEQIIEHLVRKGLSAREIAIEMDWCSAQSTKQEIQSMRDRVMSYLQGRWGFTKITAARAFFKTHYLGHHEYDYYFID